MKPSVWWQQDTPIGAITVVVGVSGVRAIAFRPDDAGDVIGSAVPGKVASVKRELDEWFGGDRREFAVDLDLGAVRAPFGRAVLETLRQDIAWGHTVTYGELAVLAGRPGAARAVGTTMANNPLPFVIPCHRVLAAGGKIGGYGGTNDGAAASLKIKRWLLAHEGVLLATG